MKCSLDTPPQVSVIMSSNLHLCISFRIILFVVFTIMFIQTDWTINQIAMINPQNIEESPSGHHHCDELEPEMEDRAQKSIQQFFDNFHLPSPTPVSHSHASPASEPNHQTVRKLLNILACLLYCTTGYT